jgi:O-antigen ligase
MTLPSSKDITFKAVLVFLLSTFSLTSYYALSSEQYWVLIIPLVLLIVYVGIQRIDFLFFLGVALTPFAINLDKTDIGIGVSIPSEPIMFLAMLLFFLRNLIYKDIDREILRHPVTIAIIIHVGWMLVTTATSSMFLVSFKATLARICFVVNFYFIGVILFKKFNKINLFIWLYIIPLLGVIAYTVAIHAAGGFTEKVAHSAMEPFYNDHTAYAAIIAMFIPLMLGFLDDQSASMSYRWICFLVLSVFVGAIVLSYTRAAWLSLIAAFLCYLVFAFRIKTSLVIGISVFFCIILLLNWTNIILELERNDEQSSTDYASHVQSASNITTDASNVERINRWACAVRMFADKPVFGWGPGTYMFQYAPYQKFSEETIISTNFGEGGNAHSEYIGALAEQGILGTFFFILILLTVVYRASRIIIHSEDRQVRLAAKGLVLGLVTYWVHGTLNNFLDTEKASVPYWGFIAAIVALDIYHSNRANKPEDKQLS